MIVKALAITALAGSLLAPAAQAAGQHGGEAGDPPPSPYAGLATVPGTTLTPQEIDDLRTGQGMRLALPAELNGFPGPLHVLELAERLGLEAPTVAEVEAIRAGMLAAAIAKGEEVIQADRALTALFRESGRDGGPAPRAEDIARLTAELARLRGELQAVHLAAHLRTRALLTGEQIARYDALRGYGEGDPAHDGEGHDHEPQERDGGG